MGCCSLLLVERVPLRPLPGMWELGGQAQHGLRHAVNRHTRVPPCHPPPPSPEKQDRLEMGAGGQLLTLSGPQLGTTPGGFPEKQCPSGRIQAWQKDKPSESECPRPEITEVVRLLFAWQVLWHLLFPPAHSDTRGALPVKPVLWHPLTGDNRSKESHCS